MRLLSFNQNFYTMIPIIFRERRTVIGYTITKKRNGLRKRLEVIVQTVFQVSEILILSYSLRKVQAPISAARVGETILRLRELSGASAYSYNVFSSLVFYIYLRLMFPIFTYADFRSERRLQWD